VSLVVDDFAAHGTIVEKYDVRRRSSDLGAGLRFGYTSNEAGFGWTNAAVLDLLAGLTRARRAGLRLSECGLWVYRRLSEQDLCPPRRTADRLQSSINPQSAILNPQSKDVLERELEVPHRILSAVRR
jgi:Trehalase